MDSLSLKSETVEFLYSIISNSSHTIEEDFEFF